MKFVISNILIFNKHTVSKEYYVNDYGNQIINFTKSVYFRVREILYKEKFPLENTDLYPGDYLVDIAKNIIIIADEVNIPEALKDIITVLDFQLPSSLLLPLDLQEEHSFLLSDLAGRSSAFQKR